ncbi:MAG: MFS transporter, partial [Deltaproteobacteria bacterium]|nr:MFS transporter [Deltaproteobacteria bacterium]
IGFGITSALMAFAQTVEQLFILRLIQGAVSGFIAATLAIVATTTPREHMGYAMGVLQTSLITGSIIVPFFGGILADHIGYRHIFLITGGFAFFAALVVLFLVTESPVSSERKDSPGFLSNFHFVFRTPILVMILLAGFMVQLANMAISPILALFVESLQPEAEHIATVAGGVFAITGLAGLISAPYWGMRGHHLGYKRTLVMNLLGAAVTFIPQAFVTRIYQLLILRFVHGLFIGGIHPALYTLTSLNVPEERRGGVMGITRSGLLLGNVAGPITGGLVASSLGMRPLFIFTAAILLILVWVARRSIQEPPH